MLSSLPPAGRDAFMAALRELATDRLGAPSQCGTPVRRPRSAARRLVAFEIIPNGTI